MLVPPNPPDLEWLWIQCSRILRTEWKVRAIICLHASIIACFSVHFISLNPPLNPAVFCWDTTWPPGRSSGTPSCCAVPAVKALQAPHLSPTWVSELLGCIKGTHIQLSKGEEFITKIQVWFSIKKCFWAPGWAWISNRQMSGRQEVSTLVLFVVCLPHRMHSLWRLGQDFVHCTFLYFCELVPCTLKKCSAW